MASLYVHIPYCEKKCIYCDFYSIEQQASIESFLSALDRELGAYAERYGGREAVETIFFGGGTPSLLEPKVIGAILERMRSLFTITPDAEITMEANPGTVTPEAFEGYLRAGVNRMSIGIQSFHADELAFLGRIHNATEAEQAVRDAYRAGFRNISCDLIFSLPKQTAPRWKETLDRALALEPKHISAYSLIVEDHTPLSRMVRRGEVTPIDESADAEIYELTMATMEQAGYEHYEISNYARPGYACRHNLNYWNHSNYLGFGPSAHSFWRLSNVSGTRWWNVRSVTHYIDQIARAGSAVSGEEAIGKEAMIEEEIFLGLRCGRLDLGRLEREFGVDVPHRMGALLVLFHQEGFLAPSADHILTLSPKGFMMCDALTERLIGT